MSVVICRGWATVVWIIPSVRIISDVSIAKDAMCGSCTSIDIRYSDTISSVSGSPGFGSIDIHNSPFQYLGGQLVFLRNWTSDAHNLGLSDFSDVMPGAEEMEKFGSDFLDENSVSDVVCLNVYGALVVREKLEDFSLRRLGCLFESLGQSGSLLIQIGETLLVKGGDDMGGGFMANDNGHCREIGDVENLIICKTS
jgi:hypothetical protein